VKEAKIKQANRATKVEGKINFAPYLQTYSALGKRKRRRRNPHK
jgi:hypothetical protein